MITTTANEASTMFVLGWTFQDGWWQLLTRVEIPARVWDLISEIELAELLRDGIDKPVPAFLRRQIARLLQRNCASPEQAERNQELLRALKRAGDRVAAREIMEAVCDRLEAADARRRGRKSRRWTAVMAQAAFCMNYRVNLAFFEMMREFLKAHDVEWRWQTPSMLAATLVQDTMAPMMSPHQILNEISEFERFCKRPRVASAKERSNAIRRRLNEIAVSPSQHVWRVEA